MIRPKLELIERAEKALDVEGLIKRAMDNIEVIEVKH